jgi:N-acetylglucosaminyldiphosphoundecaprenol N-acetyl-beta-D-mannosaminyltransferase
MVAKLKVKYPELKIVGSRNGYFCNASEELLIVEEISKIKPDMVFIALPTPQKELFISHYKNNLGVRFAFGVGGVFDVQAGKVKRAPLWMRNIGLEGLHRMIQNPADYGARYKTLYLPFIKLFFRELFKKNRI